MNNLYHLSEMGFLKIAGPEAINFMQGYTTCDLNRLEETGSGIGAICNLQGRMVTSFLALKTSNDLILRMDRALVNNTMEFLNKYIVFSKAELHDISEEYICYGTLKPSNDTIENGFRVNLSNRSEIWTTSRLAANPDIGPWKDAEVSAGVAWVTQSNQGEHLPQMFNYHNLQGLDFEKGCYLGQEIVARAHYRGQMKRRLHRLVSKKKRDLGAILDLGNVVSTSPSGLLAILKNTKDEPISATFDDGEDVLATPC